VSDVSSVTSRPVSGHTALSTKAAEARTPAQPSTRPAAIPSTKPADTGTPQVIEIHLGAPRGPIKAERVIPYGSDIEFRWTVGKLSEPPGQSLLQVVPTFRGPQPPAGDDRKGWVLKHIPGDVRSLAYGRRWDGTDTGAKDLLPGTMKDEGDEPLDEATLAAIRRAAAQLERGEGREFGEVAAEFRRNYLACHRDNRHNVVGDRLGTIMSPADRNVRPTGACSLR